MEAAYDRFIAHLRSWIIGLPESEALRPLLEARCTPQEAEFMAQIPFLPHPIERLAEKLGRPVEGLSKQLDALSAKGLVFQHPSKGTILYALNDSMFDFYRSPFWAGKRDEATARLGSLANRYFYDAFGREFGAHPTMGLRAIPVHKTVRDTRRVLPHEDLLQVLDREEYFCTSHCPCRHRKNVDPDAPSCKHETFNCLHFGRLARYMVRNGMGEQISRQQTLEVLEAAAEAGLVHGISNTRHGMDTICNCCSCCCLFLESANKLGLRGHQPSNYIVEVNPRTCKACGLCGERCPMKALRLEPHGEATNKKGMAIALDPGRCIGCGVCAHKCPTQSLGLVRRPQEQDFPMDFREQAFRMGKERGRFPLGPSPR